MAEVGRVFIVGAGPGDPGLLTLRAKELIETADVVVYDRLVGEGVLALAPKGVGLINVGKNPGNHAVPQDEINDILVRLARTGRRVVRLKGGDPLVFGRGGEEAAHLARHGIAFEIVPGITAAQGAAASLALPLTLRGVNTSLRYVTGHRQQDGRLPDYDWAGLADAQTTLVVYMGAATIGKFTEKLIAHGSDPATPAVAIAAATTPDQQQLQAPLATIAAAAAVAGFDGPVLFIIGSAVDRALSLQHTAQASHEGETSDEAAAAAY